MKNEEINSSISNHSQHDESRLDTDNDLVDVDIYEKACEGDIDSDDGGYPNEYTRKRSETKIALF